MGGHILSLYTTSHASRIRNLTANLPISIRRYTQRKKEDISGHLVEERAPSTAEEFERVAEEKSRQGFASQTTEKAADGAVEATVEDDSTFESVKEAQKEFPPGKGDFHKKGHE
ncbi:hypothetical protein BUALT_Bualt03G0122600 [Buddleja alternifolia]|uniref:Uncharacterized protein n=1 Tax=Buddleja alternifolia TaxID=168488 RepID=A0AAV6XU93_9LAMI|nr:hypothetical protein BUALT_Bualt03G0122600 [Buddleja alternifolia]